MEMIKEIFSKNYDWIFSGIGVAIITSIITFIIAIIGFLINYFVQKQKKQINIETKGNNSPGIVGGDYTNVEYKKNIDKG